ncbi:MAG: head-tail adaptor protein [Lentihominibacter sp.]
MFKPPETMTTAIKLQHAVDTDVTGATDREYIDAENDPVIFCNFKTRGGTKTVVNGRLLIIDTAEIQMHYRDDIKPSDRFILLQDGSIWNIIGRPENVEQRNRLLIITVQCTGGGA